MFLLCFLSLKHNIKKIRNNLEKSRECGNPRCLKINGKRVTWQLFKDAYNWDQRSFSLPLHEKLTTQHFELDPASKMRNHLAEEVLDDKMLFLVQVTFQICTYYYEFMIFAPSKIKKIYHNPH